ncbi:MAG: hypothetical protein R3B13_23165 [Polyangiaceae bacterium]
MRAVRQLNLLLCALGLSACQRCSDERKPAPKAVPLPTELDVPLSKGLTLPAREQRDSATGIGLPPACRIALPLHALSIGSRDVVFTSTRRQLSRLAILERSTDPVASAVYDFATGAAAPSPWLDASAPPPADFFADQWAYGMTRVAEGSVTAAAFWRAEAGAAFRVAGDQLQIADVACSDEDCAMLTTIARNTKAPGATLTWLSKPGSVDVAPEGDSDWEPLGILQVEADRGRAKVALHAPTRLQTWTVAAEGAALERSIDTPHGVYDAVQAARVLVLSPGLPPTKPCQEGGFPIQVHADGEKRAPIRASGPPDGVIARALGRGSVVAWVAPASCRLIEQRIVGLALLDAEGRQVGSTMTVTEAKGFALASDGSRLALWLRTREHIVHLTAECSL